MGPGSASCSVSRCIDNTNKTEFLPSYPLTPSSTCVAEVWVAPRENMAVFRDLLLTLNTAIDCLEQELELAGYKDISLSDENSPHDLSRLSTEGSSARLNVISTAETIMRLAKTPTERLIDYHSKVKSVITKRKYCLIPRHFIDF
jgi:hypothetical protein